MARSIFELRKLPLAAESGFAAGVNVSTLVGTVANSNLPGFTDYTSSLAWTASGSAPSLGDATKVAKYIQIGELVVYYGQVRFGSTSTYGTGTYSFSLPVTASSDTTTVNTNVFGVGFLYDNSTGNSYPTASVEIATTTTLKVQYAATYGSAWTEAAQTAPWTWAQDDRISWLMAYEAA